MKTLRLFCITLVALLPMTVVAKGPPTVEVSGEVDANVVNTVDANVVNTIGADVLNTVDANLVTTVSSEGLVGLDFGPGTAASIIAALGGPRKLLSISTGIAPDVPGEFCSFSVKAGMGDQTTVTHIGFSAMSNGEVSNVSRNYTVPIAPVNFIEWVITGSSGGPCWLTVSFVTEPADPLDASVTSKSSVVQDAVQLEIR